MSSRPIHLCSGTGMPPAWEFLISLRRCARLGILHAIPLLVKLKDAAEVCSKCSKMTSLGPCGRYFNADCFTWVYEFVGSRKTWLIGTPWILKFNFGIYEDLKGSWNSVTYC